MLSCAKRPELAGEPVARAAPPRRDSRDAFPSLQAYGGFRMPARRRNRRRRSAGSARWRCGWRDNAEVTSSARRSCATGCSMARCRRCPMPASFLFARRDVDPFDAVCDHLLVVDHAARTAAQISPRSSAPIGCCARRSPSAGPASTRPASSISLRCSPVTASAASSSSAAPACWPPYRNKRTVELLWHGIWTLRAGSIAST